MAMVQGEPLHAFCSKIPCCNLQRRSCKCRSVWACLRCNQAISAPVSRDAEAHHVTALQLSACCKSSLTCCTCTPECNLTKHDHVWAVELLLSGTCRQVWQMATGPGRQAQRHEWAGGAGGSSLLVPEGQAGDPDQARSIAAAPHSPVFNMTTLSNTGC